MECDWLFCRTLWNESSSNPQGQIKLWVDVLTQQEAQNKPVENIAPPLPVQYELRVTRFP